MNKYQKSIDELKLDENAKRRIFHRVSQNWDDSREYRLRFERMRTANICFSVFLAIFCVSNVAMAVVRMDSKPHYVIYDNAAPKCFKVGETFSCTDEFHKDVGPSYWGGAIFNGSFTFESLSVAKSIQSGGTVYESNEGYFLIIKNTLDLDEFILDKNMTIHFKSIFMPEKNVGEGDAYLDRIKGAFIGQSGNVSGCLNLEATKTLSCDFAMEEGSERPIREARGTLCLCLDIDRAFYDFLDYYHMIDTLGVEAIKDREVPSIIQKDGLKTSQEVIDRYNDLLGYYTAEDEEYKRLIEEGYPQGDIPQHQLDLRYGGFEYEPGIMRSHVFKEEDGKMYNRQCWFYGNYSDIAFYDTLVIE